MTGQKSALTYKSCTTTKLKRPCGGHQGKGGNINNHSINGLHRKGIRHRFSHNRQYRSAADHQLCQPHVDLAVDKLSMYSGVGSTMADR